MCLALHVPQPGLGTQGITASKAGSAPLVCKVVATLLYQSKGSLELGVWQNYGTQSRFADHNVAEGVSGTEADQLKQKAGPQRSWTLAGLWKQPSFGQPWVESLL